MSSWSLPPVNPYKQYTYHRTSPTPQSSLAFCTRAECSGTTRTVPRTVTVIQALHVPLVQGTCCTRNKQGRGEEVERPAVLAPLTALMQNSECARARGKDCNVWMGNCILLFVLVQGSSLVVSLQSNVKNLPRPWRCAWTRWSVPYYYLDVNYYYYYYFINIVNEYNGGNDILYTIRI